MDNFKGFVNDNKGSQRRVHENIHFLVSPRGTMDEVTLQKILHEGDPAFIASFTDRVTFLPTQYNHDSSMLLRVLISDGEDRLWKRFIPTSAVSLIEKWEMYHVRITHEEMVKLYNSEAGFIDLLLEYNQLRYPEPWIEIQKNSSFLRSMKSVYSYYWPEVRQVIDGLFSKFPHHLMANWLVPDYVEDFHKPIIQRFVQYQSNAVPALSDFPHQYPTHGASEAIWKAMTLLKKQSVKSVYVLKGEYEGFRVAAEWNKIAVQEISIDMDPGSLTPGWWFISNPSSRDGNILPDEVVNGICGAGHRVFYDLSFVGTTGFHKFDVSHPNIAIVVFSFSKPYGLFSARVGIAFSREPIESLIGNAFWFKPVFGLYMADAIIRTEISSPLGLVNKYRPIQEKVVARLNRIYDLDLVPSDSILLAHRKTRDGLSPRQRKLLEMFSREDGYRVTLTPFYFEQETFDELQKVGFVSKSPLEHITQHHNPYAT